MIARSRSHARRGSHHSNKQKKKRSVSSQRWLKAHHSDPYVKQAKAQGLRARSAYKLAEIAKKYPIITPESTVVDLGAAPGGWSAWARHYMGEKGHIYAIDRLPMAPIVGVTCLQADLNDPDTYTHFIAQVGPYQAHLVLCDMAPNMTGIKAADQYKAMQLAECAWDYAHGLLCQGGHFVIKLFHGAGFDDYLRQMRTHFVRVKIYKPPASRAQSSECYLIGQMRKSTQ